jgi:hypothetical protein
MIPKILPNFLILNERVITPRITPISETKIKIPR